MRKNDRFIQVYTEGSGFGTVRSILTDRETGVQYLFVKSGYGSALTPLLNSSGQPVIRKVYDEQ